MAGALGGEAEFDALEKHLRASIDQQLRSQLLAALGTVPGEKLQARARALVLDPAVKAGEITGVLYSQLDQRATRDVARDWYQKNFEAVFKKAPQVWQSYLPAIESVGMCSEADDVGLRSPESDEGTAIRQAEAA